MDSFDKKQIEETECLSLYYGSTTGVAAITEPDVTDFEPLSNPMTNQRSFSAQSIQEMPQALCDALEPRSESK